MSRIEDSQSARLHHYLAEIEEFHPEFGSIHPVTVHSANILGDTPLQVAVRRGDTDIVAAMIEVGADVNAHGEYGSTPLHYAASYGHTAIVQLLLAHGASRTTKDDHGHTPIEIAIITKNTAAVELLRNNVA